jgi:hypothetical protein
LALTGLQRKPVHSLLSARWIPKSDFGCVSAHRATSGSHGQGTRMLAEVAQPFSSAAKMARFTECAMPKSSA